MKFNARAVFFVYIAHGRAFHLELLARYGKGRTFRRVSLTRGNACRGYAEPDTDRKQNARDYSFRI